MSIKIYDKVKWHFPDGDCPSLEKAIKHFIAVKKWLEEKSLLSEYGKQLVKFPVGSDFAITSEMLTSDGNKVLGIGYNKWLEGIIYGEPVSTALLESIRSKIHEGPA